MSDRNPLKANETKKRNAIMRFWFHVDKTPGFGPDGDCWKWTGYIDKGYGTCSFDAKVWQAHRLSYYFANKNIINPYLVIMHKCDTPLCVNPDHLQQGTKAENNQDMVKKERHVRGSDNPFAKVTEKDIPIIRKMYSEGVSTKKIGEYFKIAVRTVQAIGNCQTWRHVKTEWDVEYIHKKKGIKINQTNRSKLTLEQVKELKNILKLPPGQRESYTQLAERFGVSHWQIGSIARGRAWKDISPD